DHERYLLVRLENQTCRVARLALPRHVPLGPVAIRPGTAGVGVDTPPCHELPQRVVALLLALDVDDAGGIVRVQLREIAGARVDPDQLRNAHLLAVDEDVE